VPKVVVNDSESDIGASKEEIDSKAKTVATIHSDVVTETEDAQLSLSLAEQERAYDNIFSRNQELEKDAQSMKHLLSQKAEYLKSLVGSFEQTGERVLSEKVKEVVSLIEDILANAKKHI
jgi:hypothetical protein